MITDNVPIMTDQMEACLIKEVIFSLVKHVIASFLRNVIKKWMNVSTRTLQEER